MATYRRKALDIMAWDVLYLCGLPFADQPPEVREAIRDGKLVPMRQGFAIDGESFAPVGGMLCLVPPGRWHPMVKAHLEGVYDLVEEPPTKERPASAIEAFDDGSHVELDSYSGGASEEGAWGRLSLRFVSAYGSATVREYAATGPAKAYELLPSYEP